MTWQTAQQFCVEKGGYLAEIKKEVWQNNINAILLSDNSYWIGLNDIANEGHYVWQTSQTPLGLYTNWYPGEPNNANNTQNCVLLEQRVADSNLWAWDDYYCSHTTSHHGSNHALCQWKKT